MSIKVIKPGIADSIQDDGRFGYQHMGINPNGVMDVNAMNIANALVGNELNEALLEMSFPAPHLHFKMAAVIVLSGANFIPKLNGKLLPLNQPVLVPSNSELKFSKAVNGSWSYLTVRGGFDLSPWLGSISTNNKAHAGGVNGRSLKRGDVISFRKKVNKVNETRILPWRANVSEFYNPTSLASPTMIRCIRGNEFDWLTKKSQTDFLKQHFTISPHSDRMGYRLAGTLLRQSKKQELLSTAVAFGTLQLLPNGELIVLMADHQTTGGYPRIAHVISADRSLLTQCRPNEKISFQWDSIQEAEDRFVRQQKSILQMQISSKFKFQEFFALHL
jgi:antagonist of KipI